MMKIPLRLRKPTHVVLFITIIVIQIIVFIFWYQQNTNQKKLIEAIDNASQPNQAISLSNMATKYYLEANNSFSDYLYDYNFKSLKNYSNAIANMSVYLDSLSVLASGDKVFYNALNSKKSTEKEVVFLRKRLDSLMVSGISVMPSKPSTILEIKKFNFEKVLKSISYDTIREIQPIKKKGLFGRLGGAIAGKTEIEKEKTEIRMEMELDNVLKSGTYEDQVANIFKSTNKHYSSQFSKIKDNYLNAKGKDRELLKINRKILANSEAIILFYSKSAHEASRIKYQNTIDQFYSDVKSKKNLILLLMAFMIFCTVLLLIYTYFAHQYENKLAKAKLIAEKNVAFKNRIIGMMSHEMRAPLNIISNLSKKLKNRNADNDEKINLLYFTSNSLQITATQILDYFKTENSKLVRYDTNVNLFLEISTILASLKSLAEQKNIDLNFNIDSQLDQIFYIDYGKVHQLFYNLIGNAIKFTKKGSISVSCMLLKNNSFKQLSVSIKDTGVGIPKEDLGKVFDSQYQSEQHKEQISFGAGLGLHLCKEIVQLYDGKIDVDSEINVGTTITFTINIDTNTEKIISSRDKILEYFNTKKMQIALLDDDKIILSIIKKYAIDIAFDIEVFETIESIEAYLNKTKVDLIVTDLNLHGISVKVFTEKLRKTQNLNKSTKILAISGDDSITISDGNDLHFDDFLSKPVNKEQFYTKILNLLKP